MSEFAELVAGYHRFKNSTYLSQKNRYDNLAEQGQFPPVMIISCCDSRVDPATIFDTIPGQVFALRNVANLVPPFETGGGQHGVSSAIEFGVCGLNVKHILVMGHGQCGGISAALNGVDLGTTSPNFVEKWMSILKDARDNIVNAQPQDPQTALEHEAIKVSLQNLMSFPFVAERVHKKELELHGAWFSIENGELHVMHESGQFSAL